MQRNTIDDPEWRSIPREAIDPTDTYFCGLPWTTRDGAHIDPSELPLQEGVDPDKRLSQEVLALDGCYRACAATRRGLCVACDHDLVKGGGLGVELDGTSEWSIQYKL